MNRAVFAPILLAAQMAAGGAVARPPVVVELYTAQGCASCDRSNAFAASLDDLPGVTALTFSVDYWDYLGWKDTFAQPEFAERQRAYDKRFGLRDVFTPQIVVDGQAQASGDRQDDVGALIKSARRARVDGPQISPRADGTIVVAAAAGRPPKHADEVWLVRYDPRLKSVQIKDGDNKGHTASYRNAVRQLVQLGVWNGRRRVFHLPAPSEDGLDTLILVQGPDGGRIVSALKESKP